MLPKTEFVNTVHPCVYYIVYSCQPCRGLRSFSGASFMLLSFAIKLLPEKCCGPLLIAWGAKGNGLSLFKFFCIFITYYHEDMIAFRSFPFSPNYIVRKLVCVQVI